MSRGSEGAGPDAAAHDLIGEGPGKVILDPPQPESEQVLEGAKFARLRRWRRGLRAQRLVPTIHP